MEWDERGWNVRQREDVGEFTEKKRENVGEFIE